MSLIALARRHAVAGWRHRWKALATAWLVCGIGWTAVQMMPDQYLSQARIYADPDALLGTVLRGIAIDPTPVGQVEILQRTLLSRPNLERIITETGLDRRAPPGPGQDALIQQLSRDIHLTPAMRNLFSIDYRDTDPLMARDVVKAVLALFTDAAMGTDRRQMENARSFVAGQIATYEQQLREAEGRRAAFQAQYADLLALNGNVPRLDAVRSRLQELRGELEDATTRRDLLQTQVAEAAATTRRGGGVSDAERRLRELRMRYTEQHPDVIAARQQAAVSRGGGGGGATGTTLAQEQLTVRLVDANALVASLERQVRDSENELERLTEMARDAPGVQAEYIALDRDYTVMRRNYEELLARRESIQIGEAARTSTERAKVEIIDPPSTPSFPVAPKRKLLALAVLFAGIGAGLGLIVLLVQLDGSFYSAAELRRIGLPVLGALSDVRPRRRIADTLAFTACSAMLIVAFATVSGASGLLTRLIA